MEKVHTHYDNLRVARSAPQNVIRAAYKALSQQHHPDRNPGNGESARIMVILNTSYAVLSDETKRHAYDEFIGQKEDELFETEMARRTNSASQAQHTPKPPNPTSSYYGIDRAAADASYENFVGILGAIWGAKIYIFFAAFVVVATTLLFF